MSVIRELFDRVEQEHRTKLEQLQKLQDEQRFVESIISSSFYLVITIFYELMVW